jgi:uncharacterized RDD family membrane protein YckC
MGKIPYASLIFTVVALLGVILFLTSEGKKKQILGMFFLFIFLQTLLALLISILAPLLYAKNFFKPDIGLLFYFIHILKTLLIIYFSFLGLKLLQAYKTSTQTDFTVALLRYKTVFDFNSFKRLIHLIVDSIFITILLFLLLSRLGVFISEIMLPKNDLQAYLILLALLFIVKGFYYYLSEVLFNRTPAKFLTKTIVVSNENLPPTKKQVIQRTLSRFIPLNTVSIFGGFIWHDKISKTTVANEVDNNAGTNTSS